MKRLTFLTAVLGLLLFFSGCGQSGPLYIPGNPSTMAVPPSGSATSDETEEEEQDSSESDEND